MADDREPYEPLWAESLRREGVRQPDEPAAQQPPRARLGPARVIAALVLAAVVLGVVVSARSNRVTYADLPSYWGRTEMTCATWRIEEDTRTLEVFRCRALDGGALPPGTYQPPGANWNSDFDRRPAEDHLIRISPAGNVVGWALYVP